MPIKQTVHVLKITQTASENKRLGLAWDKSVPLAFGPSLELALQMLQFLLPATGCREWGRKVAWSPQACGLIYTFPARPNSTSPPPLPTSPGKSEAPENGKTWFIIVNNRCVILML